MIVVVIGNYASQNLGDDMYLQLLRDRYPQHRFVPQHELGRDEPDFAILGGGGIISQKETRRTLLHEWVRKFSIRYCVMSVGSASGKQLAFDTDPFPGAEFITVRDPDCARALPAAVTLPDLAWTFEPKPLAVPFVADRYGVMVRTAPRLHALALCRAARREIVRNDGLRPFFWSTYGERLAERTMVAPIAAGFRHVRATYYGIHPKEHLENFRTCARVLTMPMHGVIFAAIYGVPWAGWVYSRKVALLARELRATMPQTLKGQLVYNHTDADLVAEMRERAHGHFELLDTILA